MDLERILVVGAGNGGQATAIDLTTRGFNVCLYEFPAFSPNLGNKLNSKVISSTGFINGDTIIDSITTDEREASEYSRVVLVTMPAFAHPTFFATFKDHLQEGSSIYFLPGNLSTLMALETTELIKRGITLVEFNSLPYGCRINDEGVVNLAIKARFLTYAAFPARDTVKVVDEIEQLYPGYTENADILEVLLNNPNPLMHPPGVLLNLGRTKHLPGEFFMYAEGMTDSVLRVVRAVNDERLKIGRELGYDLIDIAEFRGSLSDGSEHSFLDCGKYGKMFDSARYLTEDVPFGLCYWNALAKKVGVTTPNIDALITLTSTVCDSPLDNPNVTEINKLPSDRRKLREFLHGGRV